MSVTIVYEFPTTPYSSEGGIKVSHHEPAPTEDSHRLVVPGASLFVPMWNMCIDS